MFCIGDEVCGYARHEKLSKYEILRVFGDKADHDYPLRELADMALEQYEIFHIVTDSV